MAQMDPFDGPFGNSFNDELSTEREVEDPIAISTDGGLLLGEICRVKEAGHPESWGARDAHSARYGDVPGRPTGWVHGFRSRQDAEKALNERWSRLRAAGA